MATPLTAQAAGAEVVFVDCNRDDLCVSFADFEAKALEHRPRAAFVVHIGGHIAFEIERIAEFCRAEGIFLIEDCAHAHGASFHGRRAGTWGDAGIWSFAATKTISTGEGGMLVSGNADLVAFARAYRDYGKPDYAQPGLNLRMNEFTAALGIVGTERLDEISGVEERRRARPGSTIGIPTGCSCPPGCPRASTSTSCSSPIERSTGKVYDMPCHRIMGHAVELPNSDWVAQNHWCVPLYYRPSLGGAEEGTDV